MNLIDFLADGGGWSNKAGVCRGGGLDKELGVGNGSLQHLLPGARRPDWHLDGRQADHLPAQL